MKLSDLTEDEQRVLGYIYYVNATNKDLRIDLMPVFNDLVRKGILQPHTVYEVRGIDELPKDFE